MINTPVNDVADHSINSVTKEIIIVLNNRFLKSLKYMRRKNKILT